MPEEWTTEEIDWLEKFREWYRRMKPPYREDVSMCRYFRQFPVRRPDGR